MATKANETEKKLLTVAEEDETIDRTKERAGKVFHISVPPALVKRVDRVLAKTDMESYSQLSRIAIKRLCNEVEQHELKLEKALGKNAPVDNEPME